MNYVNANANKIYVNIISILNIFFKLKNAGHGLSKVRDIFIRALNL